MFIYDVLLGNPGHVYFMQQFTPIPIFNTNKFEVVCIVDIYVNVNEMDTYWIFLFNFHWKWLQ